jgi:hypothetical protein
MAARACDSRGFVAVLVVEFQAVTFFFAVPSTHCELVALPI